MNWIFFYELSYRLLYNYQFYLYSSEKLLESNLNVVFNGLNAHELNVLKEINENIFSRIQVNNWEGIEVNRYRADKNAFTKFLRGE